MIWGDELGFLNESDTSFSKLKAIANMKVILKWPVKIQVFFLRILKYFYVKLRLYIDHRRGKPPKISGNLLFGPPDFIGIGFQKSGTTWWYELISSHPNFFDPKTIFKGKVHPADRYKERHLFNKFVNRVPSPDEIDGFQMWYPRTEGTITVSGLRTILYSIGFLLW